MKRIKLDTCLTVYQLQKDKTFKCGTREYKTLEENVRGKLNVIDLHNDFLDMTQKSPTTELKLDK